MVGVFDTDQGGDFYFADSSAQSELPGDIKASFPNLSLSRTELIGTRFLETVDVLMLSSAKYTTRTVTVLSSDEQLALKTFIEAGGGAPIFVDYDSFGRSGTDAVNESFHDLFGLDSSETPVGEQTLTVFLKGNPVTSSSFGVVDETQALLPVSFDSLGSNGQGLATLANGETALAYIPRDALKPGGVILFADVNLTAEAFDDNSSLLIRNALARMRRDFKLIHSLFAEWQSWFIRTRSTRPFLNLAKKHGAT